MEGEPQTENSSEYKKKNTIEVLQEKVASLGAEFLGYSIVGELTTHEKPSSQEQIHTTATLIQGEVIKSEKAFETINSYTEKLKNDERTQENAKPLTEKALKNMFQILHVAHQTETAEVYQKDVLEEVSEDLDIPDYPAAYKRLVKERNKSWKLKPSDIADFYLLEGYIGEHEGTEGYQEDPTYMAVAKAKGRVSDIGRRLLVSLAHEQLDEYDRFAHIRTGSVPDDLRATIHEYYQQRGDAVGEEIPDTPFGIEREINAYLADFNGMIEEHANKGEIMNIFINEGTNAMFGNALRILESQQSGRWQVMAKAMRALHDNSIPMGEFVRDITATDGSGVTPEIEAMLEKQRESFLIDRLLNYVHNTGTMSARVTNYFPLAASLLLAHGISGHDDYLLFHSSVGYGNDALGKGVEHYATRMKGRDLKEDLATAMQAVGMPREYKYAVMLQFGDEALQNAVQANLAETITPTRAYTLLQRVSHHDGYSRGRIKQAA